MATFITTKSPGQTISVRVQSSTGYWTYTGAQAIYSNSVTSQAKANLVVPEDGTFEIYSCSSGNINPSGDITYLELSNNQLTSFDGTGLSELTYLDLANNELTSFNGTDLSSLQSLILNSNSLTSFDGTGLVSLTILFLNNNLNLDTFTVNDMTSLQALTLSNGSLSTIDLSTLSDLNSLFLDGNSLTSFDGTGLSALNNLTLAGNPLTSFIGGDMGQVSGLDFNGWDITTLTSVDISGLSNLRFLDLQDNNQLTPTINNSILSTLVSNGLVFDGGKIPYHFYASGGRTQAGTSDYNTLISRGWSLSGLDVVIPPTFITSKSVGETITISVSISTGNWKYNHDGVDSSVFSNGSQTITVTNANGEFTILPAGMNENGFSFHEHSLESPATIIELDLNSNQITSFDGTGLSGLTNLNLNYNQLTSFDGTDLTSLTNLGLQLNPLTSIDVSPLINLVFLDLANTQLTSIDVSLLTGLTTLYLGLNSLTSIDVSNLINLVDFDLTSNQITSLGITGLDIFNICILPITHYLHQLTIHF